MSQQCNNCNGFGCPLCDFGTQPNNPSHARARTKRPTDGEIAKAIRDLIADIVGLGGARTWGDRIVDGKVTAVINADNIDTAIDIANRLEDK